MASYGFLSKAIFCADFLMSKGELICCLSLQKTHGASPFYLLPVFS